MADGGQGVCWHTRQNRTLQAITGAELVEGSAGGVMNETEHGRTTKGIETQI